MVKEFELCLVVWYIWIDMFFCLYFYVCFWLIWVLECVFYILVVRVVKDMGSIFFVIFLFLNSCVILYLFVYGI